MYFVVILFVFAIGLLRIYSKQCYSYWQERGVPQLNPRLPFGDITPWFVPLPLQSADIYNSFKKRGLKYGGIYLYTIPVLAIVDPKYVRRILVKHFSNFADRGIYFNEEKEPLTANLLFLEDARWKIWRQKLRHIFKSEKMMTVFATMLQSTQPMIRMIEEMATNRKTINVKDTMTKFTMNVIAVCAFGVHCDCFETSNTDFYKNGQALIPHTPLEMIKLMFAQSSQQLAKKLGITFIKQSAAQFFEKIVTDNYNYRKQNNIQYNDFMQLLMELKDNGSNSITMKELIAQLLLFFMAGFDTSAATLTFCLFNLATHSEVQDKFRAEICRILRNYDGEICYEGLTHMKYMDQVLNETMRMYPVTPILFRICTEDYRVPFSDLVIQKGTQVYIPIWSMHRDPEYYPYPDRFDPERFSKENVRNIIPGTFLPFGDGPRICIGIKFGMMQMKICLASLLKDFKFSLNAKTRLPLKLRISFITDVEDDIWLDFTRIN